MLNRKPKILCIIGESGTGKTEAVEYIQKKYGIPLIQSHTDRGPRFKGENGHTFHTKDEFDKFKQDDMIAFTNFGGNRYCCLKNDVTQKQTYVMDENGIKYITKHFNDVYDIKSVRLHRTIELRENLIDSDRLKRDKGNFTMPFTDFDYHITNNGNLSTFYRKLDETVESFFGTAFTQHTIMGDRP